MFSKYSLNRLIIVYVSIGFFFLMADSILEHWTILSQEFWVYVPILFSGFGFIVSIITVVRWKGPAIQFLRLTLMAAFIVSGAGFYFHVMEENDKEQSTEQLAHEQKEKEKPILAPLSFGGIAVIGLLGISDRWKTELSSTHSQS